MEAVREDHHGRALWIAERVVTHQRRHGSIGQGSAGLAVLCAHVAKATADPVWERRCDSYLDHALAALGTSPQRVGLFDGIAGVGWAAAHAARLRGTAAPPVLADID